MSCALSRMLTTSNVPRAFTTSGFATQSFIHEKLIRRRLGQSRPFSFDSVPGTISTSRSRIRREENANACSFLRWFTASTRRPAIKRSKKDLKPKSTAAIRKPTASKTPLTHNKSAVAASPSRPVQSSTISNSPPIEQPPQPASLEPSSSAQVNLSASDVESIVGPGLSFAKGMQVLQELQFRRVTGSLADLGLDFPNEAEISAGHAERALGWLRDKYPVDEQTAAAEWAEEEATRLEQQLITRGEQLRLYKKNDDEMDDVEDGIDDAETVQIQQPDKHGIYGLSVLEQRRKQVAAEEKAEEEKRAAEREAKQLPLEPYRGHSIIVRKKVELDERKQRREEHKSRLASAAELETSKILAQRSSFSRLWPSWTLGLLLIGVSVVFAESYEPPARSMRLLPDIPPAVATIAALVLANVVVFVLWRRPEAWRFLNKYFMLSAGHPRAASLVGAMFSHQMFTHLLTNILILGTAGVFLHEELTRGPFLAIYISTGVAGGLATLTYSVLAKDFLAVTLGASAVGYGLAAAFVALKPQRSISPGNEAGRFPLWIVVVLSFVYESVMFWKTKGRRNTGGSTDHVAHLGGLLFGAGAGTYLRLMADETKRMAPVIVPNEDDGVLTENEAIGRALEEKVKAEGEAGSEFVKHDS